MRMDKHVFHQEMKELLIKYGYDEFILAALNKSDERVILSAEGRSFNLRGLVKELELYLKETMK